MVRKAIKESKNFDCTIPLRLSILSPFLSFSDFLPSFYILTSDLNSSANPSFAVHGEFLNNDKSWATTTKFNPYHTAAFKMHLGTVVDPVRICGPGSTT